VTPKDATKDDSVKDRIEDEWKVKLKEKVRAAHTSKKEYCVSDFYHDTGLWQRLARSRHLENFLFAVSVLYIIWAAVDVDNNDADSLQDSAPVFMVVNILFTMIFCLEVFVRFMAFKSKKDCCKNVWFLLDLVFGLAVILDLYVPILRFFQILYRMLRMQRRIPEMFILLKGLVVASRSVIFCLMLLVFNTYLFTLLLCTLTKDSGLGESYFPTVAEGMLLIYGILVGAHDSLLGEMNDKEPIAEVFFVIFVVSSWTILAITFGATCEVVSVVASESKEKMVDDYLKDKCRGMLELDDPAGNAMITQKEFDSMIMSAESARVIQECGVDVVGLVDYFGSVGEEMTSEEFLSLISNMRGTNTAAVRDVIDLQKILMKENAESADRIKKGIITPLEDRLGKVETLLSQLLAKKDDDNNEHV